MKEVKKTRYSRSGGGYSSTSTSSSRSSDSIYSYSVVVAVEVVMSAAESRREGTHRYDRCVRGGQ